MNVPSTTWRCTCNLILFPCTSVHIICTSYTYVCGHVQTVVGLKPVPSGRNSNQAVHDSDKMYTHLLSRATLPVVDVQQCLLEGSFHSVLGYAADIPFHTVPPPRPQAAADAIIDINCLVSSSPSPQFPDAMSCTISCSLVLDNRQ